MTIIERFMRRVEKTDGCWLWIGYVEPVNPQGRGGYGWCRIAGSTRAHRAAWTLFRGEIPTGIEVAHLCDVRNCVRPDHLQLMTHAENMGDMARKGRASREPRRGSSKLTPADVKAIRDRLDAGEIQACIADDYGVTQACISQVKHRRHWASVG